MGGRRFASALPMAYPLPRRTPYGINFHRLLVRGHRIESEDMRSFGAISDAFIIDRLIVTPVVAMPIILLLILYVRFKPAKRKLPINDEGELM